MKQQSGFTLIEIAIVLVIIGLLLGGVLKGQELIENGKIKNVINDFNGISAAVNAYRDRYRALPGDDNQATARGWAGSPNGNGNGQIAPGNPFTLGGENLNFWRHLRYAGLISGDPTVAVVATALPKNAYDGLVGVTQASAGVLGGLGPNLLCFGSLPGKAAGAVDTQLDDGNPGTGSIRATVGASGSINVAPGAAATSARYNETLPYTVCRTL
ncbi:prepilin-type N-terminal cleavage/methylation domain-containing protein [Parachitinimonas caeni]|uniref:Prepilin-type N-terminal cleavage/methylation domain-containing protein n=1 Tax=Parachitinimonas caeni TaxID=3031301 RepID=A0ABT7DTP3_9NEIS|nr:prepilin-type N-terminal cleavage/methylation domain-containing protein [Parachitinimonas caeni]MDK2123174.1 prepilin-type N-terminal cleavage/methylation domain-containing protein [Parachitinimonas caeni]